MLEPSTILKTPRIAWGSCKRRTFTLVFPHPGSPSQYPGMDTNRILVVDDNATNLKLAVDVLECAGYSVMKAEDAEQALRVIGQKKPALILMDIGLPGMD